MKLAYVPDSTVEHVDYEGEPSAERVQCATCGQLVCGGAVVNDPPEANQWFEAIEEFQFNLEHALRLAPRDTFAVRVMYCDGCDRLQVWCQEKLSSMHSLILMRPLPAFGVVLTQPCFIYNGSKRERWVERFLVKHPEAKGVLQR